LKISRTRDLFSSTFEFGDSGDLTSRPQRFDCVARVRLTYALFVNVDMYSPNTNDVDELPNGQGIAGRNFNSFNFAQRWQPG